MFIFRAYSSSRNKVPDQQALRRETSKSGNCGGLPMQSIATNQTMTLPCALRNLCLLGILLSVLCANRALAQVDQGTITGLVQDSTGAVVPGAVMTLTDRKSTRLNSS